MEFEWGFLLKMAVLAVVMFGGAVLFMLYVVEPMLSDEQRYGIDEDGFAKTPERMAEKKARAEWMEVFDRLPPD